MKKILPFLLIFCLLLTSCGKVGGGVNPGGVQGNNAADTSAQDYSRGAALPTQDEPFALYPAYVQLPLGQHLTLDADTAPAGKKLTWTSSDASVATVDENGRISPVAEGEAVITAVLAGDAGVTSTCGVLVAAGGNVLLWEYPLESEDIDALKATLTEASMTTE